MSAIKSVKITNWKNATQMASRVNDHETGFADIVIGKGENYVDLDTSHYYIVMIMSGEVSVSCKLYHNRLIGAGNMTFIPRGSKMLLKAVVDTNIILFGFTTTIIRTDIEMLEYFCTHAGKKDYTFNTLPICKAMNDLLLLIGTQLHEKRLRHSGICHVWNTYFFHMMVAYYNKDEITAFMRPIISGGADFKSFIENNYLEAGGNVSRLIILSGLSTMTFKTRFKSVYGMTAKQWLDQRLKEQILEHAAEKNMGTHLMANLLMMRPQQLTRVCHRFWGITAGEVIRRVQAGEPLVELKEQSVNKEENV